ncbi:NYN domain-containing protein [Mumia sp. ZJ1417]|uniref:NYN domain-containing protein n=1 Tax=Mumia sp. ZJ1417 TaxID=2708082 RepID=UPI0014203054|nr:NYN domain-containing protein [Mumia sp. ZJ1417]QMW64831.1 NYN domain-containing protein [Mumia sp. ZJ1417]
MSRLARSDRHAILVDAGYLLASSAQILVGTSLRRAIAVSWERLVTGIKVSAADHTDTRLLRVFWYDAANALGTRTLSEEHNLVSLLPDVKLRLGRVNNEGAQKGVDTRIALDLVNLALQGAVSEIFLVSGDDDLTEAVDMAQDYGVRVTLFNVPNDESRIGVHATAMNLARVADDRLRIPLETIRAAITPSPRQRAEPVPVPDPVAEVVTEEEAPAPPRLRIPTPSDVARLHPAPTTSATPSPQPAVSLAWSSSTAHSGGGPGADPDADLRAVIPEVVRTVVRNWLDSATQADVRALVATRPTIPGDVDSTLLNDLVAHSDDRYRVLQTETRWQLREAFWAEVDQHV